MKRKKSNAHTHILQKKELCLLQVRPTKTKHIHTSIHPHVSSNASWIVEKTLLEDKKLIKNNSEKKENGAWKSQSISYPLKCYTHPLRQGKSETKCCETKTYSLYTVLGGGVCRVDSRSKCGKIFVVVVVAGGGVAHVWSLKAKAPLLMWPPTIWNDDPGHMQFGFISSKRGCPDEIFHIQWNMNIVYLVNKICSSCCYPAPSLPEIALRSLTVDRAAAERPREREREQEHNQTGREQIVIMKNNYTVRQQGGIKKYVLQNYK